MTESLEKRADKVNNSNYKYPAPIRGLSWLLTKFPTKEPERNNFVNHSCGFSESFSEMIFDAYSSTEYYVGKSLKTALGLYIRGHIGAAPGEILQGIASDAEQRYGIKESPKTFEIYSLVLTGAGAAAWLLAFHHIFQFPWAKTNDVVGAIDIYRKVLSEYTLFVEIPARILALAVWGQVTGIIPAELGYLYYKPNIEPKIKPYIEPTKNFLRKNSSSFKEDLKLSYFFYSSQLEPIKKFLFPKSNK